MINPARRCPGSLLHTYAYTHACAARLCSAEELGKGTATNGRAQFCPTDTNTGAPVKSFWVDPSVCIEGGQLATWQAGAFFDPCGIPIESPNGATHGYGCEGARTYADRAPYKEYCENSNSQYPWYETCCEWDSVKGSCQIKTSPAFAITGMQCRGTYV